MTASDDIALAERLWHAWQAPHVPAYTLAALPDDHYSVVAWLRVAAEARAALAGNEATLGRFVPDPAVADAAAEPPDDALRPPPPPGAKHCRANPRDCRESYCACQCDDCYLVVMGEPRKAVPR